MNEDPQSEEKREVLFKGSREKDIGDSEKIRKKQAKNNESTTARLGSRGELEGGVALRRNLGDPLCGSNVGVVHLVNELE